jgi:3-hydroxyacyl-[acyl-carrier-protein] dehydratase
MPDRRQARPVSSLPYINLRGCSPQAGIYPVFEDLHKIMLNYIKKNLTDVLSKGVRLHMLDSQQIQEIIPHRYPFLLVDRILEVEAGVRAVGIKNVSVNEPFFTGHFPGYPVMPGVLIVEALAQVGCVSMLSLEANRGKLGFFAGIDEFRFRGQVVPGDTLTLEVVMTRFKGSFGKGTGTAKVGDRVVAEGQLMFALSDRT